MGTNFEYTTLAQRYTGRYPVLTYVGTQINFWIIANLLLTAIIQLHAQIVNEAYHLSISLNIWAGILVSVLLGIVYGVSLGVPSYYLERRMFKQLSLGKIILFKTATSLVVLILLLVLIKYVLFGFFVPTSSLPDMMVKEETWVYLFLMLLIYYFFMTLVISFINQVNKKYGPGVLLPLLLGRYRTPQEEERIFMFMDLKSSTTTAEELGHIRYSAFIRDCFMDINEVLFPYRAQVYQYVGDEIVLTWPEQEGLNFCVRFFFACQSQFEKKSDYYLANYGFLPQFKAGAHAGPVTAVEIGEVKRDIAYHGDTLNTAARIQSVCNEYKRNFIASMHLVDKMKSDPKIRTEELGMILLKGKKAKVGLVSIEWMETSSVAV